MMRVMQWCWRELTRPRGHLRHRFYRIGRSSRAGVALLITISGIAIMTIMVAEMSHDSMVRYQLASHERDEAKAELLANSGIRLYQLLLITSKQLGKNPMIEMASQYIGINADSLWQAVPFINTGLMRMLFISGSDLESANMASDGLTESQIAASREDTAGTKRNFLDFDGEFSAEVTDENRRIYVGKIGGKDVTKMLLTPSGTQLMGLMSGEGNNTYFRDSDYTREELIGNLADWTDADETRVYDMGYEETPYERLDDPYKPKNAPFDSVAEIRLVDGWHLDPVWEKFGKHLTIYGAGKVNVNTADRKVLFALLWAYSEIPNELLIQEYVKLIMEYRNMSPLLGGGLFKNAQGFKSFLDTFGGGMTFRKELVQSVTTESEVFRVTGSGEVGEARVKIEAIYDFSKSPLGKVVYWRVD
jgi:hypothetical protein